MKSMALVTVMIPTYNQATLIAKAIDSALAQDYENLEVVVCDDNSTDNTSVVLSKYDNSPRVRVFRNEKNLGRVKNYKHLLEDLARGEWFVNLDGDDYFTDTKFISDSVKLANQYGKDVVFVQAGHAVATSDEKILKTALPDISNDYEVMDGKDYFLQFHHFSHLATVARRSAALPLDFYRYDIFSSDIESFLRLALHGKVIMLRRMVGVWIQHDNNASKKLNIQTLEKNTLMFTAPAEYANSIGAIPQHMIRKWSNSMLQNDVLNCLTLYFGDRKMIPGYLTHVVKKYRLKALLFMIPKAAAIAIKNRFIRK